MASACEASDSSPLDGAATRLVDNVGVVRGMLGKPGRGILQVIDPLRLRACGSLAQTVLGELSPQVLVNRR